MKECMKARPNPTAKFNYAWALIRSKEVSGAGAMDYSIQSQSNLKG